MAKEIIKEEEKIENIFVDVNECAGVDEYILKNNFEVIISMFLFSFFLFFLKVSYIYLFEINNKKEIIIEEKIFFM